jgi:arsenate reductase
MKRLLTTRYGFFALASIVCYAVLVVIDPEFRWVAVGVGSLYLLLAVVFFADEVGRSGQRQRLELSRPPGTPTVLFVCVRNAGRSQMAQAIFNDRAAGRATARSAGSEPAGALHPEVVSSLAEIGLDVSGAKPQGLGLDLLRGVDVVVGMGCGDACPHIPGARRIEWDIADPAGRSLEEVRTIRDSIARRVDELLTALTSTSTVGA